MENNEILKLLPYETPFLFVDELLHVDGTGATGTFFFKSDLDFYKGHFKNNPVTPGVILTECMAQIGVVCLGIYLLNDTLTERVVIALTSAESEFIKPVYPDTRVTVRSEMIYFRFNKLKCRVAMRNETDEIVCIATIAGMIVNDNNE